MIPTLSSLAPMLALLIAQLDESGSKLTVYGPMGIICLWLMYRDEKRSKEGEKLRESIEKVAHQMKGLNRNLLYQAASHGPAGLREVAQRELERVREEFEAEPG